MNITVKLFASLREQVGKGEVKLNADKPMTIAQIWAQVSEEMPLPTHILMALNMQYVEPNAIAKAGDEVAFFPPVTGG